MEAPLDLSRELTIKQAAEALSVHQMTVRRYLRDGDLVARDAAPSSSRRPLWRIPLDAVLEFRRAYARQRSPVPARATARRAKPYTPRILNLLPD